MVTLLAIAVIVVATLYGVRINNDKTDSPTKWCVAVTCNIDSHGTEGTAAVRLRPTEHHQTQE